jgi:hypothetical protein
MACADDAKASAKATAINLIILVLPFEQSSTWNYLRVRPCASYVRLRRLCLCPQKSAREPPLLYPFQFILVTITPMSALTRVGNAVAHREVTPSAKAVPGPSAS